MKKVIFGAALAALAGGFTVSAFAAECFGTCGTLGAEGVVTAPPGGGDYQYVSTAGGLDGVGSLDLGIGERNGSLYVSDSFSASAGDSLQIYFNYITSDGAGWADYAWAALRPDGGGADILLFTARTKATGDVVPGYDLPGLDAGANLDPASTPIIPGISNWSPLGASAIKCFIGPEYGCGYTDWIEMDYVFDVGGTYSLVFGVTNLLDRVQDSGLAFTLPTMTRGSIPEPGTLTLMLGGLGLVGGLRRRGRASAA